MTPSRWAAAITDCVTSSLSSKRTSTGALDEVLDSLVVHLDQDDELILFVALRDGLELDDDLRKRIAVTLRSALSPRHVPDTIVAVPAIPRTLTGKKLELPVKRILGGTPVGDVVSPDALVDPAAIDPFVAYATARALPTATEGKHG